MIKTLLMSVWLFWNPPVPFEGSPDISFYVAYKGTNITGTFTALNTIPAGVTNFNVGPLKSGAHFFYVTAVGTNGAESDPSNKDNWNVINPPRDLIIKVVIP